MIYIAKFIFKMESILNLKFRLEENKKQELMVSINNLKKEEEILNKLYLDKNLLIKSLKDICSEKINVNNLKNYNNYLKFIKDKIKHQKDVIKNLEKIVNKVRLELIEISKEKKILEKFKEKQYEIYLKNQMKLEQKLIDEIVSYNYNT